MNKDQENIIDIAYDKKNQRYIAYSLQTRTLGYGVCVESAIKSYKENYSHHADESIFDENVGAEY